MKAARIHEFGSPDVIRIDDVPPPTPNEGEILVRVAAAGVGPWDALFRERKIAVSSPLPLNIGIGFVRRGRSDGTGSHEVQGRRRSLRDD
jgi:NADPH:quinone reductase-like Zn-dependent oxidoreductase